MNTKTRPLIVAALLAVATLVPFSRADDAATATAPATQALPPAKALFDRYVEATGGRAAYERFTARTIVGTLSLPAQNLTGTLTAILKAPNQARITQDLAGIGKIEQGFDGETLWEMSPLSGVRLIDGAERAGMMSDLTFNAELQSDALYRSAQTVGVVDVNGRPAYDVRLVSTVGGRESHAFYDVESGLLVRRDATLVSPAGEMNATTLLGDYRDFDGLKFPGVATSTVAGTTFTVTTDRVTHADDVPPGTFELPEDVKKLKAKAATTMPAR